MSILIIMMVVLLLVSYFISSLLYKYLVRTQRKLPLLWSALTFVAVSLIIGGGLLYAIAINFHR
ncbi:hypothetical protein BH10BAC2_BH10BAC2_04470 [soil metagenome]